MSLKLLEQYLQDQNCELYKFAFSLIPNDLMATQIVSDSINIFFIDRIELVRQYRKNPDAENRAKVTKFLYSKVLTLAEARCGSIKKNKDVSDDYSAFYQLKIRQRAALFLKHKTNFNYDELEEITNQFRHEIMGHLYTGREEVFSHSGYHFGPSSDSKGVE